MSMTNLPNIPTDNLYKFYAISGLVIYVSSFAFMFLKFDSLRNGVDVLEIEINIVDKEVEILKSKTEIFDLNSPSIVFDENFDSISNNSLHRLNLIDASDKVKLKLAELEVKNKIIGEKNNMMWFIIVFGAILCLFGIKLQQKGFKLWKEKVQDLADEKLEIELKLLRRQLNTKSKK